MFEWRFKEGDGENHTDTWVLGGASSRRKSKYKCLKVGEFLRLAKRPGWLERIKGRVDCRVEVEGIIESNYVDDCKLWVFFFCTIRGFGTWE